MKNLLIKSNVVTRFIIIIVVIIETVESEPKNRDRQKVGERIAFFILKLVILLEFEKPQCVQQPAISERHFSIISVIIKVANEHIL